MRKLSICGITPLVLVALALVACENNPAGLRNPVVDPTTALAVSGSSIPQAVTDAGKLVPHTLGGGYPDLTRACTAGGGTTVTGIAFDGTYIYVGHGGYVNSCITRYNEYTGAYIDQKNFRPDVRGLHWVQGLGKLVARTFGGSAGNQDNPAEIGRFFTIDYAAGTATLLTGYDVQTCNPQGQPGVDREGTGYWTNCGSALEHRRMSDGVVIATAAASPFFTETNPVWASVVGVAFQSGAANQYALYDRATDVFAGTGSTVNSNGCSGYGVGGLDKPEGTLVGTNLDCTVVRIEDADPEASHGPMTPYPGTPSFGHIKLCKDASSPPGIYYFDIGSSGTIAGDVVQDGASLAPGQCRIIFSRTAASNVVVFLTVTELASPGTIVDTITRTNFGGSTVFAGPNPTITAQTNSGGGAVLTYKNKLAPPT